MAKLQALLRRAYDFGRGHARCWSTAARSSSTGGQTPSPVNGSRVELSRRTNTASCWPSWRAKGKVVSREKLMERLWETDSFIDDNTLTVNVEPAAQEAGRRRGLPDFIATRFGVGYLIP